MEKDALRVAQLAMMLSSDWPKGPLDAVFFHALSKGMIEAPNLCDFTAQLYHDGTAPVIAINGGDGSPFGEVAPGKSWPGMDYYVAELTSRGVPSEKLIPTGSAPHTREEANQLIITAKEHGWKRIGIVTVPYHYPRVFCYLPEPFRVHGWQPDMFALTAPSTDWYLPMGASQGKGMTTSEDAALDDAGKVLAQIEKGWAAPLDQVFEYLRSRTR